MGVYQGTGSSIVDDGEGVDEDVLDALLDGLGGAVVDLLDAVNDRVDELGPASSAVVAGIADRLRPRWASTPVDQRPLLLLDTLRAAVSPRR